MSAKCVDRFVSRFERFSFVLVPENCGQRQDGTEKKKSETDLSVKRGRGARRSGRVLPRVTTKGFPTRAARPGPTNLLKKKIYRT